MKLEKLEQWVYELDSWVKWPIISIIGWIHGNEPCGLALLEYIKKDVVLAKWKLFLITGNIDAISQNIRQCDVNLNRIFKEDSELSEIEKASIEYRHMGRIKKYLDRSDACLDIHSSPTKWSPVFVICEQNSFSLVKDFPVTRVCEWFSQVESWGTDYYMFIRWKPWVCVECWFHGDKDAFLHAKNCFFSFLHACWLFTHKKDKKSLNNKIHLQAEIAYITQSSNYIPVKDFDDFEEIYVWQLLGYDDKRAVYSQNNGYILFSRERHQPWVEAFVELVKILWEA